MSWDWLAAGHVTTVLTSDWSAARDSLGLILTLDTIADTNTTLNLSPAAVSWFKHARFDVKTVTDVVNNMENGIKHVIQVGYKYTIFYEPLAHCTVWCVVAFWQAWINVTMGVLNLKEIILYSILQK